MNMIDERSSWPVLILLLAFVFQSANAENLPRSSEHALDWLQKIASAPRQNNFQGTFIYYADDHIEASRITHRVDHEGEYEKIEVLDGLKRIVYRNNEEMKCYLPDSKKIYTEKRWFRKFFPDLLPQLSGQINENYSVELGETARVAGQDCQVLKLIPRDNLRYGYKFWIHVDSGLLLKVAVVDKDDVIEQFAFAQIEIGDNIDGNLLNTEVLQTSDPWQTINLSNLILKDGELDWQLVRLPAGFKKVTEMRRDLVGRSMLVDHIVLSDGLASVSVFVEPLKDDLPSPVPGFYSSRGAINIYVRELKDNKITTVGEVPLNTIKMIGDAVMMQ